MIRKLLLIGAILVSSRGEAAAKPVATAKQIHCVDAIAHATINYVAEVQGQIGRSIRDNVRALTPICNGGYACSGGTNHGSPCNTANGHADCPGGQCVLAKGSSRTIAGGIANASTSLGRIIANACAQSDLDSVYGSGNSRCRDLDGDGHLEPAEIASCVLGETADSAHWGDPFGEVLGRGTPSSELDPGTPLPTGLCRVELGGLLETGSQSPLFASKSAGAVAQLDVTGCVDQVCDTTGHEVIPAYSEPPRQDWAGPLPLCIVTATALNASGASESGTINLVSGMQTSFEPVTETILLGVTCPLCDKTRHCDGGPNLGGKCSESLHPDTACPPSITAPPPPPRVRLAVNLTTETSTLSVPADDPPSGVTNPGGALCGICDLDHSVGCQNDSECVAAGICGGLVGSGCCTFGTNTGAFGDPNVTSLQVTGVRNTYLPRLAGLFCIGQTGNFIIDTATGLPGSERIVRQQLNSFVY